MLEVTKIFHRRFSIALLIATVVLLPSLVKIGAYMSIVKDKVPEYLFADTVAFGTIMFTQIYFLQPVWIIVLIGQELSNGYVNRVAFARSRKFYFLSKLIYCCIIAAFLSIVSFMAFFVSIETAPFKNFGGEWLLYLKFIPQIVLTTLVFSIFLMCLVFVIGSPLKTFVVYFVWSFVEGILFLLVEAKFDLELKWLPLHLVRTLYVKNGELQLANYYNPFFDNLPSIVLPVGFVCAATYLVYKYFLRKDLPVLSE